LGSGGVETDLQPYGCSISYILAGETIVNAWMVRAGEGGDAIEAFEKGFVAVGYGVGDLSAIASREAIRDLYRKTHPDAKPGKATNAIAILFKIRSKVQIGDNVVTYDPNKREYLVGNIQSDYFSDPKTMKRLPHSRRVKWEARVSRDLLPLSSRNSLGSTLGLFAVDEEVWASIAAAMAGKPSVAIEDDVAEKEALDESREDVSAKAHELVKDQILRLSDSALEQLTAALLRAMGYRTRISSPGADRGVDIFASPDGLGFQEPRIKVEVKHRSKTSMGAPEVRSFIGGLREGDRGLYVSTGGFTKEAKYEAERSKTPVTLLDLDELATSIMTYYESFDSDGRAILPLVKMYWPTGVS
jgi:restriction system protein